MEHDEQRRVRSPVRVRVDGRVFTAQPHERLDAFLLRHGFAVSRPCGGMGTCGKCRVRVDGAETLACRFRLERDCRVELPAADPVEAEAVPARADTHSGDAFLALDLGTTTLAMARVSAATGEAVETTTAVNPQRAYGADVMSRIAAIRETGVAPLQRAAADAINRMTARLGPARTLFVSGNTTMLHILFGVDPSGMGAAPYTPVFLDAREADARTLGLTGVQTVRSLPGIAAFVGADLTAGLLAVKAPAPGRHSLLIDLGTNAEIVLFSASDALCTAAAAGPCFEGANISCGMSAVPGAVFAFRGGEPRVIGGGAAKGLCGSGLVDLAAHLLQTGAADETGYMPNGGFPFAPGLVFTQADLRQYQLAKAAVCAAIETLLAEKRVRPENVDTVWLSGGFSSHIDVDSADATGLIPASLREKCVPAGNTSLAGTIRYGCGAPLPACAGSARYRDLTASAAFSELFIERMAFCAADFAVR